MPTATLKCSFIPDNTVQSIIAAAANSADQLTCLQLSAVLQESGQQAQCSQREHQGNIVRV